MAQPVPLQSVTKVRWSRVMPALIIFSLVIYMDRGVVGTIIASKTFLSSMGLTHKPVVTGLLDTVLAVVYGVFTYLWGVIADRISARVSGSIGLGICALAMIMAAVAPSVGWLFAAQILLGVGAGVAFPIANKISAQWYHPAERGTAQQAWYSGNKLSGLVGTLIVVGLLVSTGWRSAFWAMAIITGVISLPMLWWFTRDNPEQDPHVGPKELAHIQAGRQEHLEMVTAQNMDEIGGVLSSWRYWLVNLASWFNAYTFFALLFWLSPFLVSGRHFSLAVMGAWKSAEAPMAVVLVMFGGWLSDRTQRPAVVACIATALAAASNYIAATTLNAPLAAFCADLSLALLSIGIGLFQVLVVRYSGPRAVGRASGLLSGMGGIAGAISPPVIGLLLAKFHGNFTAGLLMLTASTLLSALFLLAAAILERPSRTTPVTNASRTAKV